MSIQLSPTAAAATTTSVTPLEPLPDYLGYLALLVCLIFFGSNTLPIKKFETNDGMFYQLCVCLSIWSVGAVVNAVRDFPVFYFLPMLGGACWTTACVNNVPMIKMIGLGMATLISGTVAIVTGWANARFGIFGTKPELPSNELMNYAGVALCAVSTVFYILVKSETQIINPNGDETRPLLRAPTATANTTSSPIRSNYESLSGDMTVLEESQEAVTMAAVVSETNQGEYVFDRLSPKVKRVLGTTLAVVAGVFLALAYVPYLYVIDNYASASQNSLDYVFSMYTGILLTSLFYFAVYCLLKRNRPYVNVQSIFPAFMNGWIWGLANCCFLFANTILSQVITFAIAGSVPSMIATLYGIFLFHEIKGKRNFFILIIGFTFTTIGSVLCGLSK